MDIWYIRSSKTSISNIIPYNTLASFPSRKIFWIMYFQVFFRKLLRNLEKNTEHRTFGAVSSGFAKMRLIKVS